MHEVSIANSLFDLVLENLPVDSPAQVHSIRLRVGSLTCVNIDALAFSWHVITQDTPLQGALIEHDMVPLSIYCETCQAIKVLASIQSLRCPCCDTPSTDIRSGRELELDSIELLIPAEHCHGNDCKEQQNATKNT